MAKRAPHRIDTREEAVRILQRAEPRLQMAGRMIPRLLQANGISGGRILMLGAAAALIDLKASIPDAKVTAVDRSRAMVEEVSKKTAGSDGCILQLLEDDTLPFADGHFEATIGFGIFLSADDPAALLREIERVLARTGKMLLNVPIRRPESLLKKAMKAAVSMAELRKAIKESGLRDCRLLMRNRQMAMLTNLQMPTGPRPG